MPKGGAPYGNKNASKSGAKKQESYKSLAELLQQGRDVIRTSITTKINPSKS